MKTTSGCGSSYSPPLRGSQIAAYFLAITLPLLIVAIRVWLAQRLPGPLLIMLMPPITLCAYIGGIGPGLCATGFSALVADFFLFNPVGGLTLTDTSDRLYLTIFIATGMLTSMLSERSLSALRQRERVQQRLSALAHLVDSTDDAIVATTPDGQITHWNRAAEKIFGLSAAQVLDQPVLMLFPPAHHEQEQSVMTRVIRGEHVPAYEMSRMGENGLITEISTTVSAILDLRGQIIGISRISSNLTHQKRMEHARAAIEDKFCALVELSLCGVYILQDNQLVYANQAMADIFGFDSIAGLLSSSPLDLVAPDDRPRVQANILLRQYGPDEPLRYRFNGICRDGSQIVAQVHGRRFQYNDRVAIIGTLVDDTETAQSHDRLTRLVQEKTRQLHQSEQQLHTILDNMPAMISYYDPDLRHLFGNQAYCEWHGVTPDRLVGLPLRELIPPEEYIKVKPYLELVLSGVPTQFEHRMVRPANGELGWHAQIHLVPDSQDGKFAGIFGLILDISPLKAAERAMQESEARFRQLFEHAPAGISLYHNDGTCMMVNQALADLLGATREQVQALNFRQLGSWQRSGLLHIANRALESGQRQHYEVTHESTFGKTVEMECEFTVPEIQGERYLMLLAKDITPFRQATQLIRQAMDAELEKASLDRQYRQVVENMTDGFFTIDLDGRLLDANEVYARMTGYSRDELLTMRLGDMKGSSSDEDIRARIQRLMHTGTLRFESWQRRKDGTLWPSDVSSSYSPGDGKIYSFTRDITEMKRAQEEIRRLAFFDSLTRLPNRQMLLDRLNQALNNCQRSHFHGALLFIDLDNFKQLNDTLGHDMGDRLLVEVAGRLSACVRAADTVARLGGDEFIIMLENLDTEREQAVQQVRTVANIVMDALNQPYALGYTEYHNTPSVGAALFSEQRTTVEDLMKQADLAMYQAKSAGRNTVCFFDPQTQIAVESRTALEAELRNALRQDHLNLYFQPQVDRIGNIVAAEALIRWHHPERGMIAPGEFIALAEDSGLVHPLGLKVLELACAQLADWSDHPGLAQITIAINVSAREFLHPDFVQQIRTQLQRSGIHPSRLKLELTESLLLHDIKESTARMAELKSIGVAFSLDDFGTGYSSLAYLKSLPLEQLKIDQSFVHDILTDPNDAAIVRAIIVMGHSLGLIIVAEGVETQEQWAFLLREGCDIGQGYFFSAAVTSTQFERLRQSNTMHSERAMQACFD